ncbi:MAG: hypothetical protein ATN36_07985 [Epulopiscium sp. Nele67-Bin005]|nr:MAG: hypothetical protein ATN36_07985 [Epulopiscium sp. Nele67-Bin005]
MFTELKKQLTNCILGGKDSLINNVSIQKITNQLATSNQKVIQKLVLHLNELTSGQSTNILFVIGLVDALNLVSCNNLGSNLPIENKVKDIPVLYTNISKITINSLQKKHGTPLHNSSNLYIDDNFTNLKLINSEAIYDFRAFNRSSIFITKFLNKQQLANWSTFYKNIAPMLEPLKPIHPELIENSKEKVLTINNKLPSLIILLLIGTIDDIVYVLDNLFNPVDNNFNYTGLVYQLAYTLPDNKEIFIHLLNKTPSLLLEHDEYGDEKMYKLGNVAINSILMKVINSEPSDRDSVMDIFNELTFMFLTLVGYQCQFERLLYRNNSAEMIDFIANELKLIDDTQKGVLLGLSPNKTSEIWFEEMEYCLKTYPATKINGLINIITEYMLYEIDGWNENFLQNVCMLCPDYAVVIDFIRDLYTETAETLFNKYSPYLSSYSKVGDSLFYVLYRIKDRRFTIAFVSSYKYYENLFIYNKRNLFEPLHNDWFATIISFAENYFINKSNLVDKKYIVSENIANDLSQLIFSSFLEFYTTPIQLSNMDTPKTISFVHIYSFDNTLESWLPHMVDSVENLQKVKPVMKLLKPYLCCKSCTPYLFKLSDKLK